MKKPSDKQIVFACWISRVLNKPLPTENTAQAYFVYIRDNLELYQKTKSEIQEEHVRRFHKSRTHASYSVMDKGEDAEWAAAMDFSWM